MNIRNILSIYTKLQSSPLSQQYLQKCYESLDVDAERKSYDNTYRLIYYLEHGQTFYKQAEQSPLSVQPILYFYGMAQFLKAAILTKRPDYPEATSVLAHGVTSRKRKKQNYSFLQDEVKIQNKGLFSYVSEHMFHMEHFPKEKFTMDELLRRIPEMKETYGFLDTPANGYHIGQKEGRVLTIPISILDDYHWSENYFKQHIHSILPECEEIKIEQNSIKVFLTSPIAAIHNPYLYVNHEDEQLFIPNQRSLQYPLPELLSHYLILYNLSMLSRYETEWWGDILHSYTSEDLVYIRTFLEISKTKIPWLIADFLASHVTKN